MARAPMLSVIFPLIFLSDLVLAQVGSRFGDVDTTAAVSFFHPGIKVIREADYDSAIANFQEGERIHERMARQANQQDLWEKYVAYRNEFGYQLWSSGHVNAALTHHKKTLAICRENLGTNHVQYAHVLTLIGNVYGDTGNDKDAKENFQKALDTYINLFGGLHVYVGQAYGRLGVLYYLQNDYDMAISYYNKMLSILNQLSEQGQSHYGPAAHAYNIISLSYTRKGDHVRGLKFQRKSLQHLQEVADNDLLISSGHENMGLIYFVRGDYDTALQYYKKSLTDCIRILGEFHHYVADRYVGIGKIYREKGDHSAAIKNQQMAVEIVLKTAPEFKSKVAELYLSLGSAYLEIARYDSSLWYFSEALDTLVESWGENHNFVASAHLLIGDLYVSQGRHELAFIHYKKSLEIRRQLFGEKQPDTAETYLKLAELFLASARIDSTLYYCQKAIISSTREFGDMDILTNPSPSESLAEITLLSALTLKAASLHKLYSSRTGNTSDMRLALSTCEIASDLIERMRISYKAEGSMLHLAQKTAEIYDLSVSVAKKIFDATREKHYQTAAFGFAEKNKATILSQSLQESVAKQFGAIAPDLLARERDLRIDLAYYDTEIQKEKLKKENKDDLRINDFEDRFFSRKREYDALIERLEESYPEYYGLKYKAATVTIPELQKALLSETAILEYFIGRDSIYLFAITDSSFDLLKLKRGAEFDRTLAIFVNSFKSVSGRNAYLATANRLYEILIAPVVPLIGDRKHWVIIPDGDLYQIPFEALLSEAVSAENEVAYEYWNYLIQEREISYHYSATLFVQAVTDQHNRTYSHDFVAFAPVFSESKRNGLIRSNKKGSVAHEWESVVQPDIKTYLVTRDGKTLDELRYSAQEVQTIASLFASNRQGSRLYLHEQATEENFKDQNDRAKYLHVATHGFVQNDYPKLSNLAFSQLQEEQVNEDGILYSSETFNLNLTADLLVLSACQSGAGKIAKGEGLMALTRGFLYSGARNIIASLWKVFDQHTSQMMVELYRQILSGKSYSAALREAKMKMISSPETAGPQSWAAFVLIGR